MPTLHFHVTGRVQGVWFRGWTQMTARGLGLVGWVRNEPDGSVRGAAQAPVGAPEGVSRQALESFRLALRQGPPSALVAEVAEEWREGGEASEEWTDFRVLR